MLRFVKIILMFFLIEANECFSLYCDKTELDDSIIPNYQCLCAPIFHFIPIPNLWIRYLQDDHRCHFCSLSTKLHLGNLIRIENMHTSPWHQNKTLIFLRTHIMVIIHHFWSKWPNNELSFAFPENIFSNENYSREYRWFEFRYECRW